MLKPLTIKQKSFPINIIQGPLAGVSSAPFRLLTWQYGRPAFTYTEMMSCKTLIYQPDFAYKRFVVKLPGEGPVCYQLSGSDPLELAEATRRVTDLGADLIDLNCGCPVNKIRSRGAGSSLLTNPTKLFALMRSLKESTHVPVSIKIRVEGNSSDKFNSQIAQVVKDAGIDFLNVHGRHWREHYETPCHYDDIEFFVNEVDIPVIGNGDVACVDSLNKMYATGCAGVMIARAGVGQPWLVRQLLAELKQENYTPPSAPEIGAMFIEHVRLLIELLDNESKALLQIRKIAKYYARTLEQRKDFCAAINTCENFIQLKAICRQYFNVV